MTMKHVFLHLRIMFGYKGPHAFSEPHTDMYSPLYGVHFRTPSHSPQDALYDKTEKVQLP
jgi:hypothetical protein